MKDWVNFIFMIVSGLCFVGMIVSGLCFVGTIVLILFWPSVIPAFSTFTKLLLLFNLLWVAYWVLVEVFVKKY
jgi:hypothetical protein